MEVTSYAQWLSIAMFPLRTMLYDGLHAGAIHRADTRFVKGALMKVFGGFFLFAVMAVRVAVIGDLL
jgi:hypothetical protein